MGAQEEASTMGANPKDLMLALGTPSKPSTAKPAADNGYLSKKPPQLRMHLEDAAGGSAEALCKAIEYIVANGGGKESDGDEEQGPEADTESEF